MADFPKVSKIKLVFECYKLAGFFGLVSCAEYLSGRLTLDEIPVKSSEIPVGAFYE